jgi:hypothetical protein
MFLSSEESEAVWLALLVAARAVGFGLPLAVLAAWVLTRCRFPGRSLLNALVHLPMVLPPVVTGWLLLILFGIHGPIGLILDHWLGIRLAFTTAGASLACATMTFPIVVRSVRSGTGRPHPGRGMAGPIIQRYTSARLAWDSGGRDRRLCNVPGRVRCRDNICCQHSRSNSDLAVGDLRRASGTGWRNKGRRIVACLADACSGGAAIVRVDRQAVEPHIGPMRLFGRAAPSPTGVILSLVIPGSVCRRYFCFGADQVHLDRDTSTVALDRISKCLRAKLTR